MDINTIHQLTSRSSTAIQNSSSLLNELEEAIADYLSYQRFPQKLKLASDKTLPNRLDEIKTKNAIMMMLTSQESLRHQLGCIAKMTSQLQRIESLRATFHNKEN